MRLAVRAEEKIIKWVPFFRERTTLYWLASFADHDGSNCWASVDAIAERAAVSYRTVQRHLRKLEKDGYVVTKFMASGRRTNLYWIPICARLDVRQDVALVGTPLGQGVALSGDTVSPLPATKRRPTHPLTRPITSGEREGTGIVDKSNMAATGTNSVLPEGRKAIASVSMGTSSMDGDRVETQRIIDESVRRIADSMARDASRARRPSSGALGMADFKIVEPE
jgi:DNA-binding transcriptional ArsR family regulator